MRAATDGIEYAINVGQNFDEPGADLIARLDRTGLQRAVIVQPSAYAIDNARTLDAVRAFAPDVVLLDLEMPDMSGYEVLEALRAAGSTNATGATMRVFALLTRLIDLAAGQTPWVTLHLALRQLGRQSQDYIRPLLLVIISLAIGVYTISMAASLDQWLVDRMSYASGASLSFQPAPISADTQPSDGNWIPQTGDFTQIAGVQAAARVGSYPGRITPAGGREVRGVLLAIDRLDFPKVSWWRKDFSTESLGAMMNRLALSPDAALVSHQFLAANNLQLGDKISALVNVDTYISVRLDLTITGTFEAFPTVYEEQKGVGVVANLDYLVDTLGYVPLHSIWLKLAPGVSGEQIIKDLPNTVRIGATHVMDTRQIIADEQAKLERVGIFGTLTVGFLATAVMAVMGLLVYSYASLRDRVYRFAILNALGLLRQQIIRQVIIEYTFLAIFGAAAGAGIGITISRLIVPFFRYTGEQGTPMPPIIPVIAENQVIILAVVFALVVLAAEILTILTVFRQQLARLIKTINQ
ncbi:MAG TPA: FtsX-like permease family protein [Anaerolinea sp.]|nr:FtsX-like permease family protein [Anaerolinea sp.]